MMGTPEQNAIDTSLAQVREKAQHLLNQGKIQAAADNLWDVAKIHRNDAATWHMLGNIYRDHGSRFTDGEKAYRKALKLDSTNATIHADFGLHCFKFRRLDDAEKPLKRAIKLSKTPYWAHRTYGLLLKQQRKYDEAQENLALVKYLQPDDPVTLFGLCTLYICRGDTEKAMENLDAYLTAVDLADHFSATLRTLVSDTEKDYITWLGLGEELFYARRFAEARDTVYTAVAVSDNVGLWNLIYTIERQQGLDRLADLALNKALAADPDDKETLRLNAMQYVNMGLYYEAETPLVQYLQKYPDDEEMQRCLEEVYDRMDEVSAGMMDDGYYA